MTDVFVIAGPSAVGKTTLARALLRADDRFSFVRSMTTRPPRSASDDEYIHVTQDGFQLARERGALLECVHFGDHDYGTPRSEIDRIREAGQIPLLILDIEGVRTLKKAGEFGVFSLYLYDELNTLEKRLYDRELATSPSVEALLSFSSRKEGNIRDYLTASEFLAYFDAVLKSEELHTLADRAAALFFAKRNGKETITAKERARIAQVLYRDAFEKTQYHMER